MDAIIGAALLLAIVVFAVCVAAREKAYRDYLRRKRPVIVIGRTVGFDGQRADVVAKDVSK